MNAVDRLRDGPPFAPDALLGLAAVFDIGGQDDLRRVTVERTRWDEDRWAIRCAKRCLNVAGQWEWEPIPSSRDGAFFARCRFARDAALTLAAQTVAARRWP